MVLRRSLRALAATAALLGACLLGSAPARADVLAQVDIASQRLTLVVDGEVAAVWPVSTARPGYYTPRGSFRPKGLELMHYSRKYDNSPMPHSVFFTGGYAIHGTYEERHLGRPASHGCVRLSRRNATTFYNIVREQGLGASRIEIL